MTSRSKVTWVKVKGHVGQGQIRVPKKGRWAHDNVKLLHLFNAMYGLILTGYGGLSLSIEGPSKADIECHDNEDGSCRVTYKPTEPGNYIINVKFADEHVPGKII